MPENNVDYQVWLRTIGAYLDGHSASFINVLETSDGFAIRYQKDQGDPELAAAEIKYGDLQSLESSLETRRSRKRPKPPGSVGGRAHSYQNFFRALGRELHQAAAWNILLDELPHGFVLTYLYLDPRQDYNFHKRMVFVGPEEQEAVLQSAYRRRTRQPGILSRLTGAVPQSQPSLHTQSRGRP